MSPTFSWSVRWRLSSMPTSASASFQLDHLNGSASGAHGSRTTRPEWHVPVVVGCCQNSRAPRSRDRVSSPRCPPGSPRPDRRRGAEATRLPDAPLDIRLDGRNLVPSTTDGTHAPTSRSTCLQGTSTSSCSRHSPGSPPTGTPSPAGFRNSPMMCSKSGEGSLYPALHRLEVTG